MLAINLDRDDKNADWLHSLKRADKKVLKSKIYLKPQEKPPEGLEVKRGPKGGLYYETKIKISPKLEPSEKVSQTRKKWVDDTLNYVGDYNLKILEKKGNTIFCKMRYGNWKVAITFLEDSVQIGNKTYYYGKEHGDLLLTPKAKKAISFFDALSIAQCDYTEEAKAAALPILLNQKVKLRDITQLGIETKTAISPLAFRFYDNAVFKRGKYGELVDSRVEYALDRSRIIANMWYEAGQVSGRIKPEKVANRIKKLITKKDKRMMLSTEVTTQWTKKYGAEKVFRGETSGEVQKEIQSLVQTAIEQGKDEIHLKTAHISSWTENEEIAKYWKEYSSGDTRMLLSLPKEEYAKSALFNYQIHDSEYPEQEITLLPEEFLTIKLSNISISEPYEKLSNIVEYLK